MSLPATTDLSRRGAALLLGGFVLAAISGCAGPAALRKAGISAEEAWSGRLSLRVDSEPAQTFSASFDLRGGPQAGELTLTNPIGSTLARLHWAPGEALLENGSQTRRFDSVDALSAAATGAAIPVGALFAWLAGRNETVPGWRPDLSQVSAGRLQATRESPQPRADLRIVFERA
ncbi:lipoprotein insertase outer membrane protein LolB [Variovorax sp. PBL-E5]|uniref:lipoprotein insertase outer membrane protein LolB n=1 Tax=Variovorax sp. PBL-E5 TaxID=434014 RepID=UPI001319654C|nr:lipoprotein insertase outer membrane protein LolB [Variovorax sp. PBL-E5]VTU36403.1 outer membrane lipoprotein LolB [Variovorax sp. PBL-E5]